MAGPFWRRILIAGGFSIGIGFLALLAFFAYTIFTEGDGEPQPQVAQPTQTAAPTPAVTPTPAPEATPEPTEEPPVPPALEEQQPPPQEQPPPTEEPAPPPPTEEPPPPPPPTEAPPAPPPAEEAPPPVPLTTELPSPPQSAYAAACQAWVDAGTPATDLEGLAACTLFAGEICTAWLSDPSVAGGAEACALVEMLSGYTSSPPSTGPLDCRSLEGAIIVADDGQYLGVVTCNKYDVDGIFNKYGSYGSKYSSTSIWNKYGSYGGKYSPDSAFNKYSSSPPQIVGTAGFLAYLSVNRYAGSAVVDPLDLVLCCFGDDQSDAEYWLGLIP